VIPLVTETSHAVFLSYASQDAQAAQKICDALRAAGVEVFLDQSELRGGDAWDQKIRREIHDCALFIPVISTNTASRHEGYFRLEWDLADQRTHMIARSRVFVVPVCLDATTEVAADVPESFRRVQWTRLPEGETPPAFVERVQRLLFPEGLTASGKSAHAAFTAAPAIQERVRASRWSKPVLLAAVALVVLLALAYVGIDRFGISKHPAVAAFDPPPHSIAVLPFVNMSADKEQEYFSDGLTEEILNSLARINDLQVAARTSAFSFKGKDVNVGIIGRQLNVGAVLEGSVRRSANKIRITAQLINATTGFHLWSQTYDRDLGDMLKLQAEIADAVAGALKVRLLGDTAAKIELGGTHDPAALDAYLRGLKASSTAHDGAEVQTAIDAYTDAIRIDPNFALAFAARSIAFSTYGAYFSSMSDMRMDFDRAHSDAQQAIALAPELADGHLARANATEFGSLDFERAAEEYQRAMSLAPGNAAVVQAYGQFAVLIGRTDAGIAAARHAVLLDPLNPTSHRVLTYLLYIGRRFNEAIESSQVTLTLDPENTWVRGIRGTAYYALGDYQGALASCEKQPDGANYHIKVCLAVSYHKLGKQANAETILAALKAEEGDSMAYQYAEIYTQWGDTEKALTWLDAAMRLRDPGLSGLKTDPLLDPLRKEPRFQAVERELKFPS
jgi:TolB-like protein